MRVDDRPVVVTGAAGFVGRHLVGELRARGDAPIVGIVHRTAGPMGIDEEVPLDLGDPASHGAVRDLMRRWRPRWIIHLAGGPRPTLSDALAANAGAAANLLDAAHAEVPDARVLVVGSAAEYGSASATAMPLSEKHPCRPESPYGVAKHAQTLLALEAARRGQPVVVARPFNLIGAGMPAWTLPGALLERAQRAIESGDDRVRVGNLETARDFVDVRDAIAAFLLLLETQEASGVYNIASGQPVRMRHVVEELLGQFPRPLRLEVDPLLVRAVDPPTVSGDASRLKILGWCITRSLQDSVRAAFAAHATGVA